MAYLHGVHPLDTVLGSRDRNLGQVGEFLCHSPFFLLGVRIKDLSDCIHLFSSHVMVMSLFFILFNQHIVGINKMAASAINPPQA